MCQRCFFFLLFFLFSTEGLQSQGMGPDFVTPVNNPFAEMLRPAFDYESGELVLRLSNGFRETVLLTQIELRQARSRSTNLLKTPVDVCPAETKYINLDPRRIDLSQKIRLVLRLFPKPPKQKSEFVFRFERETNRFVEVE